MYVYIFRAFERTSHYRRSVWLLVTVMVQKAARCESIAVGPVTGHLLVELYVMYTHYVTISALQCNYKLTVHYSVNTS